MQGCYFYLFGLLVIPQDATNKFDGVNFDSQSDNGWGISAAIGYEFSNGFRIEFEPSMRYNKFDVECLTNSDGEISATSGKLNLLWGPNFSDKFRPYIGAGIGISVFDRPIGCQSV